MAGPWYRAIPTATAQRTCTNVATFDTAYANSANGAHDEIVLSAGTYTMVRTIAKAGLIIRAVAGAHVIIHGGFNVTAADVWLKDLEITYPDAPDDQSGVVVSAANVNVINCYIHDMTDHGLGNSGQCILTSASSSSGALVYGTICHSSRHVVYPQCNTSQPNNQWWAHNYIGDVTDIFATGNKFNIHSYSGSNAANVYNIKYHENICANGNPLVGADGTSGIVHDFEFTNNRFYKSSFRSYGKPCEVKFNNNHFYEGGNKILEWDHLHGTGENTFSYFHESQFNNNLIYKTASSPSGYLFLTTPAYVGGSQVTGNLRTEDTADNNSYYGPDFFNDLITSAGYSGAASIAAWRTLTAARGRQWDTNSTYTNSVPPNRFDLFQNDYDADKALLFVIRYSGVNVPVTLARTGSIYDVHDPWGAALYSGASSYNVTQTPGFFLVKYDAVGGGGFPVVADVTTTNINTNQTTHNVNYPATVNAGDLLILFFAGHLGGNITDPGGWTRLFHNNVANLTSYCAVRKAAGNEDGTTFAVVDSTSERSVSLVYRITGWRDSGTITNDVELASALGSFDPPSLDPANWAIENTLWLAGLFNRNIASGNLGDPVNYTNPQAINNFDSENLRVTQRSNNVAAEDPSAYSWSDSSNPKRTVTIAVRPSAGGAPPDPGATVFGSNFRSHHGNH